MSNKCKPNHPVTNKSLSRATTQNIRLTQKLAVICTWVAHHTMWLLKMLNIASHQFPTKRARQRTRSRSKHLKSSLKRTRRRQKRIPRKALIVQRCTSFFSQSKRIKRRDQSPAFQKLVIKFSLGEILATNQRSQMKSTMQLILHALMRWKTLEKSFNMKSKEKKLQSLLLKEPKQLRTLEALKLTINLVVENHQSQQSQISSTRWDRQNKAKFW